MKYTLLDEETGLKYEVTLTISNVVPIISNNTSTDNSTKNEKSVKRGINIESLYPTRFLNYVPSTSAACNMRFYDKSPRGDGWKRNSFLIHTTGNVICPGKKDLEQIDYNFIRFYGVMDHIKQNFYRYDPKTLKVVPGYPRSLPITRFLQKKSEISNIVMTCIFPHKLIKLNEIRRLYSQYAKYYPMKFPALDLKYLKFEMFEFSVTYMIFNTGKILILGATNKYQIDLAFRELVNIISKTYKSFLAHEKDNAWMYTYFKYGNRLSNTKIIIPTKKRKIDQLDDNSILPIEDTTESNPHSSAERIESYHYPQVYYTRIYGMTREANDSGLKTLIPTDFMPRVHNIYTSNHLNNKKYKFG